ncbi:hypothetical protein CHS0354_005967 [Potamilus streckersoni]|uniref:Sialomucin core protein 24 n=1 Tax=Potamilus streckersoni TaxID=2493646 RepID=A0AAE0VGP3_9BIVA|nr:hypothetical protein CHS0354_005967 [Potamilus streckersoni]
MEKAVFVTCVLLIFYIGYNVPQGFAEGQGNVNCTNFNMTKDCCNTNLNGSCIFLNCTDNKNETHEGCHDKDTNVTDVCKDSVDTCQVVTTKAPITTLKPVKLNCSNFNTTKECCNTNLNGSCIFLNCTDIFNKTHEGCHDKNINITDVCKDSVDTCQVVTTKAPTTTLKPATTTEALKSTPSGQSNDGSKQHFDAASFVGGIVLCLGIVAIIFFGCKFYKARTERNYHTL